MHAALWKLYRLRYRGALRTLLRSLRTLRGAALAVMTLGVFAVALGPNLALVLIQGRPAGFQESAGPLRDTVPFGLFVFCLLTLATSAGERAIYFSASEIDFLFAGPFSRRQLLIYKIANSLGRAAFVAAVLATTMSLITPRWSFAFVGVFLAVMFIHATSLSAQLVAQIIGEQAYSRARRLVLGAVAVLVGIAAAQVVSNGIADSWLVSAQQFRESPTGRVVLAPFVVFANILASERVFPDFLAWSAVAAAMVGGLYAVAISLDANYLEMAVRVNRKVRERVRRAARGDAMAGASSRLASSRLPRFPWLGGAGPLARRQLLQAIRSTRGFLVLAALMGVCVGVPVVFALRDRLTGSASLTTVGIMAYLTFLASAQVPLAFRGDYDQLDLLKSLPIRPLAIACGQLLVVVALATLLQWAVFGVVAVVLPRDARTLVIAAAFAPMFNLLTFAGENLLFLLFPSRIVAGSSGGFLHMGRTMVMMLAKTLVLTACGGAAAGVWALVWLISRSWEIGAAAGWLVLVIPGAVSVGLVAWAFQRLDISLDVLD